MAQINLDSFKIEYAEFGSGPSRVEVRNKAIVSGVDGQTLINGIRDVLLSSGWTFMNPYPTFMLGAGTLVEHRIIYDDDGNQIGLQLLVGELSATPFINGPMWIVVERSAVEPLYPPTMYRVTNIDVESGTKVFDVVVESGVDRSWLPGAAVKQVRGTAAGGQLLIPGFSDIGLLSPWGMKNSFTDFGAASGPIIGCGSYAGPGQYGAGGICPMIGHASLCMQYVWRVADRNIRPSPFLGYFQGMTLQVTIGRDRDTGDINDSGDYTGTIGNNPIIRFPSTVSPYYGGTPSSNVYGGGWVMQSYPSPLGVSFGVAIILNSVGGVNMKFLGHGHTISNFTQFANHTCPVTSDYDDQFFLPEIFNAPEYTIFVGPPAFGLATPTYSVIANPYQFWVIDQTNSFDSTGAFGHGGNSIFGGIPFIDPSRTPGLYECAIVVGPGMLMNTLRWNGFTLSIALNGPYVTGAAPYGGATNGIGSYIFPVNQPLRTRTGQSLFENAYVWSSPSLSIEATVTGKIYDGVVISEYLEKGSTFSLEDHVFEVVSHQGSAPICSLAICVSPTSFDNF